MRRSLLSAEHALCFFYRCRQVDAVAEHAPKQVAGFFQPVGRVMDRKMTHCKTRFNLIPRNWHGHRGPWFWTQGIDTRDSCTGPVLQEIKVHLSFPVADHALKARIIRDLL